jgi:hypothetical protein
MPLELHHHERNDPVRSPPFPLRQVQLDFHTSPDIPDVGADWDAAHWIETLRRATADRNAWLLICCCLSYV